VITSTKAYTLLAELAVDLVIEGEKSSDFVTVFSLLDSFDSLNSLIDGVAGSFIGANLVLEGDVLKN
jgi:hypothetical protein